MGSKKEIALYYPYIDIDDGGLIKTAALYWDELQTIVPESVLCPYESPISREATDSGFLKPRKVNPEDESVKKTGDEFCADIEQDNIKQNVITGIRKVKRKRFSRIHFEKWAPDSLFKVWQAIKNDIPLSPDIDDYVIFPEPLGNAYMSRLASVIAQKDKTTPLTNLPAFQDILIDRFINYEEETQAELAKLSLQTVRINRKVPLINILHFRDNHRKELLSFRRAIRKLSRQIGTGLNTAKRQQKFQEIIKDEVLPSRQEIEAKLSERDIAFGFSALDITQATLMGAIASQWENLLAGVGGGLISLTISLVRSLWEDRNIIKGHPLGYLYRAHKKFGAKK
ncbi:MAG: hypothetical protein DRP62_02225 [Planctomycetota bacterium]|nr:MAG: hypothetical protein DRP62_02225 [Planctomycetota bacterium]